MLTADVMLAIYKALASPEPPSSTAPVAKPKVATPLPAPPPPMPTLEERLEALALERAEQAAEDDEPALEMFAFFLRDMRDDELALELERTTADAELERELANDDYRPHERRLELVRSEASRRAGRQRQAPRQVEVRHVQAPAPARAAREAMRLPARRHTAPRQLAAKPAKPIVQGGVDEALGGLPLGIEGDVQAEGSALSTEAVGPLVGPLVSDSNDVGED